MWLASSTNWGTNLQDQVIPGHIRSPSRAQAQGSVDFGDLATVDGSKNALSFPHEEDKASMFSKSSSYFDVRCHPMSNVILMSNDSWLKNVVECWGWERMIFQGWNSFVGVMYLVQPSFWHTKGIQGARFSLRGINKCCDWKGRWKPGWIHILFAPWQITSESIPEKEQGHRTNGLKRWKITSNLIVRVSHPLW